MPPLKPRARIESPARSGPSLLETADSKVLEALGIIDASDSEGLSDPEDWANSQPEPGRTSQSPPRRQVSFAKQLVEYAPAEAAAPPATVPGDANPYASLADNVLGSVVAEVEAPDSGARLPPQRALRHRPISQTALASHALADIAALKARIEDRIAQTSAVVSRDWKHQHLRPRPAPKHSTHPPLPCQISWALPPPGSRIQACRAAITT